MLAAFCVYLANCGGADKIVGTPVTGVLVPAISSVTDSAPLASAALRIAKIALATSSPVSLAWRAERAQNAAWLGLVRSNGNAPDTLEIRLNPAGLAPGLYRDTVVLSTNNYEAPPVRLPVAFTVHPCRVATVPLGTIVTAPLSGADCGSSRAADMFARLFEFAGVAGDSITLDLVATGFDAQLVLDTVPTAGTAPPLARATACRGAVGDPCITYFRLPATRTYYVEVSGAAAAGGTFVLHVTAPTPPAAPDPPRQLLADSVTAIAVGAVVTAQPVVFTATLRDPDLADSLRLELELRTTLAAFTGTPTHTSARVANGALATLATTVPDDSSYHWRARAADQTGRRGPWVSFGANAETAGDFVTAVPQAPAPPGGMVQLRGSDQAPLAVGAASSVRSIAFRATVTDPDPGDQLRLEIEVRLVGTAFANTAMLQSSLVTSGTTAEATLAGLPDNTSHHWQARVIDQTGRASPWTSYGANAETSADFVIAVPATQLVFTAQPGTTTAGTPLTPALQVTALDGDGNTALSFTDSVTLALGTNPGGGTLSGSVTVKAELGVASFVNARVNRVGSGYTLTATAPSLPGVTATSATFSIVAGPPTQLAFTAQPTTAISGVAIAPALQLTVQDAGGNTAAGFSGPVTVALGTNPAAGTLSGTLTITAVAGVATFSNLRIDKAGSGYTLVASAAGLIGATSAAFTVAPGAATSLTFTVVPVTGDAGLPLTPAVQVSAYDAQGNTATGYTGDVTLAIAANPGGGTLSGTTIRAAVAGLATFPGLSIDMTGVGYTLAASALGVVPATSSPFTITPATAARLVFGIHPANAVAGAPLAAPVQVRVQDGFGNLVMSFSGVVTVALGANAAGGTLAGMLTIPVVGGTANFADLSVNKVGADYTLVATSLGVSSVTSAAFTISHAAPSRLAFTVQPSSITAGGSITPTVQIVARDAFDNTATAFTGAVTVTIGTNPGAGTLFGTSQVNAVAGSATFPGLGIDKAGTGYTLTAAATGLSTAISAAFNVTPGAATQLAFTVQPASAVAASVLTPAVQVTARDAHGNTATGFAGPITLTLGSNPGGGTLSGPNVVTPVAGVATFANLSINKAGSGYTLAASAEGGTVTATSAAFNITPGAATKLAFLVQPSDDAAGSIITPAIQVAARDAQDNTATSFTGTVTVALAANPGSGTLSGTLSMSAVAGVATFGTLSIDKTGAGYTLTAAAGGLTNAISAPFTISAAPATLLVFTVQPASVPAGTAITPAVRVTAQDALGNTATSFTGNVTIAIAANPSGGTLSGPTTVAATAGVATFASLAIDRVGTGYTLSAAAAGTATAVSAPFNVVAGAATELVYTVQPSNAVAGVAIAPAIQVTARDAGGNTATGFTGLVTLAIGTNPGGATLAGTITLPAVAGVVTFGNVSLTRSGVGYILVASATGVTSATSAAFDITPGVATQLAFAVQPTHTGAGASITPAIQVAAQDALGNTATSFTGSIGLALLSNPGGGTITGGGAVTAVAGVATFPSVSIDKVGAGYQLGATAAGLVAGSSVFFNITPGIPTQLVFTEQPTGGTAGVAMSPPIYVVARDAHGNTATQFTGNVTVALGSNPNGGTLSGTAVRAAVAGAAIFDNLSVDIAGPNYRLSASSPGLTAATSVPFIINMGPATQLDFVAQPTDQQAGAPIAPTVRVAVRDAFGNLVWSYSGTITLTLTNPSGATLSGGGPVLVNDGVATFPSLNVNKVGTGYTLQATSGTLAGAISTPFTITAAPASVLLFAVQPAATTVAGATLAPIEVLARDAFGNIATGFTGNVTLAIGVNPGSGTLLGTTMTAAVNGVATFSALSINKSGTGYTLTASFPGMVTPAPVSVPFNITPGQATQLAFTIQPVTAGAATAITPAVQVTAQDANGNTATGFSGNVTVAIGTNPAGGTLAGGGAVAAVAGVATFASLAIDKAGTGYTLSASSPGLPTTTSTAFSIVSGAATQLVFTQQPTSVTAGVAIAPPVQVTARDAQGNTATGFTGNVTLAIGTNPGGSTLTGGSAAAAAGVATFDNLRLNRTGSGYTLTAAGVGTAPTSVAFAVIPAPASLLVFTQQPTNSTAGVAIAPAVQVTARDSVGNTATSFTGNISLAILNNPGGGTLTGGGAAALAGVATFPAASINKTGVGYVLSAAATGLTNASSGPFSITPGAATQLAFTVQPVTTVAATAIAPAVHVTARDAQGNTATGFAGTVTVAIGTNPGGGVLSGTTTVAATAGVATFATLAIDRAGSGYTLAATATGPTGATSTAFNITPGAASVLVFTTPPSSATAGVAMTPPVVVTARDAQGNTATGFAGNVTIAIGANPGGSTLSGTPFVAAVAGVATFANLRLDRTGTGYTLQATSGALLGATSSAFNITPAAASVLLFSVQPPASTVAATTLAPAIQVLARDAFGNNATGFTGDVTLAIGANPGSGTLSGTASIAATAGLATFSTLSINKSGTGYTLTASAAGVTGAISAPFTITPGPASALVFTAQPTDDTAGVAISPVVQVTARDAQGNTATGFAGNVTIAIGANPGGSTLSGTPFVAAVAGVATFANLRLDRTGTGYTLQATSGTLTGATSTPFNITPAPASVLLFTVQPPASTIAGATLAPAIQVLARDEFGNNATGFTGTVTLAIGANPGGGTLSGTASIAATAGLATFSTLSINKSGTGYTLAATASAPGVTGATSAAFDITPGVATHVAFTVQPTHTAAGTSITPAIQVAARDAQGNTATGFTGSISLALASNPGSGTLTGGGPVSAVAGVATFPGVSINKTGAGYQLLSIATDLISTASVFFNITPGTPTQLVFTEQPTGGTAGVAMSPIHVTARDANGNTATQFTGDVTAVLATNPNGGTLSGTTVRAAVAGVAVFDNLSIDRSGTGYQLSASATGLTTGTSSAFGINFGPATQLVYVVQPTDQQAGVAITPTVRVKVVDSQGNLVWTYTGSITLMLTNPNGAILSGGGPIAINPGDGFADFPALRVDKVGTGYTLQATSGTLAAALSTPFNITSGVASVR